MYLLANQDFPNFSAINNRVISPRDRRYNCICWAASSDNLWWWPWPSNYAYWPAGVPRQVNIGAFEKAFETLGYKRCKDGQFETGIEKIAIYANSSDEPTHAARQLPSGEWTSKLGRSYDIEHTDETTVEGPEYGLVVIFMDRKINKKAKVSSASGIDLYDYFLSKAKVILNLFRSLG